MLCLPLSKSSWPEGRIGKEESQDYFIIVKNSIDLLKNNKVDKILLLSNFKYKNANKSELDNMIDICNKHSVDKNKLHIEEYGYDTLSQLKFTLDLCSRNKDDLLIISSFTHYPRVKWIAWRINKKYNVNVKHKIGWGIPRIHDFIYDIPLIFIYPVVDLLGLSNKFSNIIRVRRGNGHL